MVLIDNRGRIGPCFKSVYVCQVTIYLFIKVEVYFAVTSVVQGSLTNRRVSTPRFRFLCTIVFL